MARSAGGRVRMRADHLRSRVRALSGTELARAIVNSVSVCGRERRQSRYRPLRLQGSVQERQADIHPVVDVRVGVVEFLIPVRNPCLGEPLGQEAAAVVQPVLVAPAATGGDALQTLQADAVSLQLLSLLV